MLKRIMASLGIGTAKVNLKLEKGQYRIGESVKGRIIAEGGSVDQEIKTLDVDIVLNFSIRDKKFSKVIETLNVSRNLRVKAGENREIPFEHYLPVHYPISKGSVQYRLISRMDISRSVDSSDTDILIVLPGKEMALILEAMEILGLKEKFDSGKIGRYGQELNYYPTTTFAEQLRELGFKFYCQDRDIKMFLELKLSSGNMFSGAVHHTELAIPPEMLEGNAAGKLAVFIKEFIGNEIARVSTEGPKPAPDYQNYQQHSTRPGFGGFAGGLVAGLLGAMMLNSLFDIGGNEMPGSETAEGEFGDGGGSDFGFGDFGDDI